MTSNRPRRSRANSGRTLLPSKISSAQLQQVKKLGSFEQILGMLPGMGMLKELKKAQVDQKEFVRMEAIINSMTREERRNADILNASRRRRIADGSGTSVQDVNRLLKSYEDSRRMMRQMMGAGGRRQEKEGKIQAKRVIFPFLICASCVI